MGRETTNCTAVAQEMCNMIEYLLECTRDWVWGMGSVTGYTAIECERAEKRSCHAVRGELKSTTGAPLMIGVKWL